MNSISQIILVRVGWVSYSGYHLSHMSLPSIFQSSVLILFVIAQLMKLEYCLKSETFDDKAEKKLHFIHVGFLILVLTGCFMELSHLLSNSKTIQEITNCIGLCIFKITIYVIIEYMTDFLFSKKVEKLHGKQEADKFLTFGNSLERILAFIKAKKIFR